MSYNESQKLATAKYNKATYDDIKIRVAKGEREKIKKFAERKGKSLNAYINDLIKEDMKNE